MKTEYRPEKHSFRQSIRDKANTVRPLRCNTVCCVLENPGYVANVASALRNIDALGVAKCYIVSTNPAIYNIHSYQISKGSSGASKWVYVKVFKSTQECISYLQKKNYAFAVTSPHPKIPEKNIYLHDANFTVYPKLAVWFGNETHGISSEVLKYSNVCIQIQMAGMVESLNLSCALGIVLYEVTKQRRAFTKKQGMYLAVHN
jgi:tRNA (guanosine-2'-O-)-methyltransferase